MFVRRLLKFLHTMGAIGLMGAMAALVVMMTACPPPSDLAGYALMRDAMAAVAKFVFFPSLGVTLIAGLIALAATRAYHNAGWAWLKLVTGILIFEGGFVYVEGPMVQDAENAAAALAGKLDPATLAVSMSAERGTLWVLLAVATLNVALGVWRPRLSNIPD